MKLLAFVVSALSSLSWFGATTADAKVIQITELGQIVSYTYDQFIIGSAGTLLNTVNGYADDRGFLYSSALDRYLQITELGQIVSYTYDQFITGGPAILLGTVGGYSDDSGFFHDFARDRYVQITELGQIVSYTYDQFIIGSAGTLLNTVNGYANDRGFLYVPDAGNVEVIPLPLSASLLGLSLPTLALLRRRRDRPLHA
ncbi:hypothetical protein [Roseitranquillus sediminis]|uniref:hypothetical protein n=1 Tax=Roseitranquillus sediminis TaxID=2809051 RepID=UPI001D0C4703|nr:hypothetical protein [Roseitranquillus sediminis]MBM9595986.1 hypothetical protein [Roseitranquillus sediminis]